MYKILQKDLSIPKREAIVSNLDCIALCHSKRPNSFCCFQVTREQRITVKGPIDFIQRKTRDSNSRNKESFIVKALERFELGSQDIKTTKSYLLFQN